MTKAAEDLGAKWVAAYDAGDAAAIAALFTPDAVFIPASGAVLKGRDAIEKALAGRMKAGWTKETVKVTAWAVGDYALIGSGENEGKQAGGKFGETLVHDANGWHFVVLVANAPPPKQ
jgi:uncharacterized protein (TIGR02246 family)